MTDSKWTETNGAPSPARAPYHTPQLKEFGTFAALTRVVGMMGLLRDMAGTGMNKTM